MTLKLFISILFTLCSLLIFTSCQSSQNPINSERDNKAKMKMEPLDGSIWFVTSKSCAAQSIEILGIERFQFKNGFFAHMFKSNENEMEFCYKIVSYSKHYQSGNSGLNQTSETSILLPLKTRTVCKNKSDNTIISDLITDASDTEKTLTFTYDNNLATADFSHSKECSTETLHVTLKKTR